MADQWGNPAADKALASLDNFGDTMPEEQEQGSNVPAFVSKKVGQYAGAVAQWADKVQSDYQMAKDARDKTAAQTAAELPK